MSTSFDLLPIYDPILKNRPDILSDIWAGSLSTLMDTLISFLGETGVFIPNLSTEDRDKISSPQLGQLIYNTDDDTLEVWQIKAGIAAWRAIDTTP